MPQTNIVTQKTNSRPKWFEVGLIILVAVVATYTTLRIHAAPVGPPLFNVASYGAKGDSQTDDTSAVQAAINAAASAGGGTVTASSSGLVFSVSSLTVQGSHVTINLNGATIKARQSVQTLITINGTSDDLVNTTVNANQLAGTAIFWKGPGGVMQSSRLTNGSGVGLSIKAGGSVSVTDVTADNFHNVCLDSGGGTLITTRTNVNHCGYAGFYFSSSGGNVLDGTSTADGFGAYIKNSNGGHINHFVSNNDNNFGLYLDSGTQNWSANSIETDNTGLTVRNRAGTGTELVNTSHSSFNQVTSNGNAGYAFVLAVNSNNNNVGSLSANDIGNWDSDPGLLIDTGAYDNRITQANISGYSVCVHYGETNPTPPVNNWIGTLQATHCGYDAIRFTWATGNRIDKAIVTDSRTVDSHNPGTVDFDKTVSDNSIGYLDQKSSTSALTPTYSIYFAPGTNGNRVEGGVLHSWLTAAVLNQGHNYAPFNTLGVFVPPQGSPPGNSSKTATRHPSSGSSSSSTSSAAKGQSGTEGISGGGNTDSSAGSSTATAGGPTAISLAVQAQQAKTLASSPASMVLISSLVGLIILLLLLSRIWGIILTLRETISSSPFQLLTVIIGGAAITIYSLHNVIFNKLAGSADMSPANLSADWHQQIVKLSGIAGVHVAFVVLLIIGCAALLYGALLTYRRTEPVIVNELEEMYVAPPHNSIWIDDRILQLITAAILVMSIVLSLRAALPICLGLSAKAWEVKGLPAVGEGLLGYAGLVVSLYINWVFLKLLFAIPHSPSKTTSTNSFPQNPARLN